MMTMTCYMKSIAAMQQKSIQETILESTLTSKNNKKIDSP